MLDFLSCFARVADASRVVISALYGPYLCIICVVMYGFSTDLRYRPFDDPNTVELGWAKQIMVGHDHNSKHQYLDVLSHPRVHSCAWQKWH